MAHLIDVFAAHESQVRSYCRSFPHVLTTAKGSFVYDRRDERFVFRRCTALLPRGNTLFAATSPIVGVTIRDTDIVDSTIARVQAPLAPELFRIVRVGMPVDVKLSTLLRIARALDMGLPELIALKPAPDSWVMEGPKPPG